MKTSSFARGLLAASALALTGALAGALPGTARAADTSAYQVVLPSIKYTVIASGSADGTHPTRKDNVRVVYEAGLADGTIVDKSEPEGVVFPLGKLIPAWQVVVPMMRPGDEWKVYAPFQFAYGVSGKGDIPPSTDMVFKIKLIAIAPPDAEPAK